MIRTYKIILPPSPKQLRLLKQHADYARDAYNWTLRYYKDRRAAEGSYPASMLAMRWKTRSRPGKTTPETTRPRLKSRELLSVELEA